VAKLSGLRVAKVSEYRAYVLEEDGRVARYRAFVCDSDADATVWAKQLFGGHDIELWSGDRLVARLKSTGKRGAVFHKAIDGRMMPTLAK
jgi:hypothetical protein